MSSAAPRNWPPSRSPWDIKDKRLVYSGDGFDAAAVTTKCYDTPPKGCIAKPVAHFQSVRFTRLNAFLQKLKLPVFVSDIDLLLQRGMKDLLERSSAVRTSC
jgi:hypothetical protein